MFNKLPTLTRENILVFYFGLPDFIREMGSFYGLLSRDEKEKAQRFFFEKDRSQYVLARGVLRTLLGHYVNILPESVRFSYHAYGKPYLKNYPAIQFNIAHSEEMVIIALNYEDWIGVDIEYIERKIDVDNVAKRFFNEKEYSRLMSINEIEKRKLFFYQWTAKEAFVKAIGRGLAFDLANVEISLNVKKGPRIATLQDAGESPENWTLYSLDRIPQYTAVLAVKTQSKVLIRCPLIAHFKAFPGPHRGT